MMYSVINLKVLEDYKIWVQFNDGCEAIIDIKPMLNKGIALELLNLQMFNTVEIESGGGIMWQNGFDICPNALKEISLANLELVKAK